ncbi:O-antigen ligase family protein [Rhodophyticola porphyridii]|uniref:O-antigen ligase domain-containing protein n=1 Tax=Rhodophyticola porphyridii TaxID=1852017 RepID=A0A3L9Y2Q8_9RHOB|nr:O-antigen ligase family protein [Rhodophyticola porphyridii]RMA41548.1 O-antigen ligase domain-containing protein [Rhodophyticola porphyridii]
MTILSLPFLSPALRAARFRKGAAPALDQLDSKLAALTVFLSPMNFFRLDVVYLTLADAAACATLLVMLLKGNVPRAPLGMATPIWLAGTLALAAGLTIGSVANGEMLPLVVVLLQYSFSLIVLVYVLAGRGYRQTVALMKVLVFSIAVVMAFGAYVVHYVPDPDLRLVSGSGRMRSLVERENAAAALGSIAIVLLLNLTLHGEFRRITAALVMPLLLYGVILTGSNTGLIITVFGITVTALFSGSTRVAFGFFLAAAMAVVLVMFAGDIILPEVFRERVLTALTTGDLNQAGTFEDRYFLIREALETARHTLVVGLGADQYSTISAHGAPVHNAYLLLLTEGGLISLFGLVLLLMTGVTLAWAAIAVAGARTEGLIALTIILIYAAMLNFFAHFYARFWGVPLVLALALAAACLNTKPRNG